MAIRPNARLMMLSTYKGKGPGVGLSAVNKGLSDRFNRFISETHARTASTPYGYDVEAFVAPIKAGGMSALNSIATISGDSIALTSGGLIDGTGSVVSFDGTSSLALQVALSGNVSVCLLSGDGATLALTAGLSGSGSWVLTGVTALSMIVPMAGAGTVANFTGSSDLKGLLSLAGEFTPFTELSPENLARKVWESLLAEYTTPGTAGNALGLASSGGVDYSALAAAVWNHTQ